MNVARDDSNKNLLFQSQFYLSPKTVEKKRIQKSMLRVLGELGGFLKIMQSICIIFIEPVSMYLLSLVMLKRLFFAKTKEDNIFKLECD